MHVTVTCDRLHVCMLVAKPVTVGWGKKETQFHGSEGKAKAKQVTEKVSYFSFCISPCGLT